MTSFSSSPKPTFVYNVADDTWYEVAGKIDTAAAYEWSGDHQYLGAITGQHGINNFLNPTDRDNKIPSPLRGTMCFIRQDENGRDINELQVFDGTDWFAPWFDLEVKSIMGVFW